MSMMTIDQLQRERGTLCAYVWVCGAAPYQCGSQKWTCIPHTMSAFHPWVTQKFIWVLRWVWKARPCVLPMKFIWNLLSLCSASATASRFVVSADSFWNFISGWQPILSFMHFLKPLISGFYLESTTIMHFLPSGLLSIRVMHFPHHRAFGAGCGLAPRFHPFFLRTCKVQRSCMRSPGACLVTSTKILERRKLQKSLLVTSERY